MKVLFLVYHGFSAVSGISKKIHYQVKGLRENGYDVRLCYYDFAANGHRCRFVDGAALKDYGTGSLAAIRQRIDYDSIFDYCVREGIDMVYARCFQNATPWLFRFFRKLRLVGIRAVTEIPTYPYDQEFSHFEWKMRLALKVDQLFRRLLYSQMDALVTFSDAETIFGQRTIRISNGVDFDSIPLHCVKPSTPGGQSSALHLIGVAEVHPWHAFDRVIAGIGEYERMRQTSEDQQSANLLPEVFFHVVGGVHPDIMDRVFQPLIERYRLQDRVIFHGQLFGEQLDAVFNQCQFAIGSLGRHRSGITVIKTLKNREYATRGIPFIYSETDSDFDGQPYVLKAPADESPVDIRQIVDFMKDFSMPPADIRHTVEHLTWKIQMRQVVDQVFIRRPLKIVFITPSLYMSGGVERVLTTKANYFAETFGYDITIILTEGKGKPLAYPLSEKIKVVNLDINFEELWNCSFVKKVFVYLRKQRTYRRLLTNELMRIRPDVTDSLLRREINFLTSIKDGSKKIGELHVNRANYRNFEANETNWFKDQFAKFWMHSLIRHLRRLDRFVVLTDEDKRAWSELDNVVAIHNPVSFKTVSVSPLTAKRVIAVGRYTYQKGFDLLLQAWKLVEEQCPDWQLAIYGEGDRTPYEQQAKALGIDPSRCHLNPPTGQIQEEYVRSSVFVVSSRFEGLSMALLEAISCGLPVVSFACPCGPRDVITDGVDGILVEKENVRQLADRLTALLNDGDRICQIGAAARQKAGLFKIEYLAEQWKKLFESL